MNNNRRNFVKLLTLSGISIVIPSEVIKSESAFNFGEKDFRNVPFELNSVELVIYCNAFQLINKPEELARVFNSLGYIAKQKILLDTNQTTLLKAIEDTQKSINERKGFEGDNIGPLYDVLKNEDPQVEQLVLSLRFVNAGIFSGLGGYAAFAIAGIPGILVSSILTGLSLAADYVLSEKAPELVKRNLEFNPSKVQLTNAYYIELSAFLRENAKAEKDLELLRELNKNGYFIINPDEKIDVAIKKLPQPWQKIVNETLDPKNVGAKTKETIRENLTNELKKSIDKIDKNVESFIGEQRKEKNDRAARLILQEEIQYNVNEIDGIGKIGNFIFSMTGNEEEGRKFQAIANVAAKTYEALASKEIGPFALAGSILNAAGLLLSIFADPKDRLLELLKPLNQKLDLLIDITYKISEQQRDIIKSLKIIYGTQLIQKAQLDEISNKLTGLSSIAIETTILTEKKDFLDSKDQLDKLFAKGIAQLLINKNDLSEYATHTTKLFTYACTISKNPSATGYQIGLDHTGVANSIQIRKRCDRLVGLFSVIGSEQNIAIDKLLQINSETSLFVNPMIWAEGAKFYLESRVIANSINHEVESRNLKQMWLDGLNLSEAIRQIIKPDAIDILGNKLLKSYGYSEEHEFEASLDELNKSSLFIGELFRSSSEIFNSVIKETIISEGGTYVEKRTVTESWSTWSKFSIKPDYFQDLLDQNLVLLEPLKNQTEIYYIRINAEGIYKGSLLVPEPVFITNDKLKFYPNSDKVIINKQFKPFVLHEASKKLYTSLVYRKEFIQQSKNAIHTLIPKLAYNTLSYYGEIFRLLDTLIKWCSKETDIIQDVYLMNSIGPFSLHEISSYYTDRILNKISLTGDWPLEIISILKEELNVAIADVKIASSLLPLGKVPPLINDVMFRLKGYMIAKGITLPNSSINYE